MVHAPVVESSPVEADISEWSSSKTYHVLTSIVAPRPIAWVTTLNDDGTVNAAPFSWYQSICPDPPLVMMAFSDRDDGSLKDTPRNMEATGEFVVNSVTRAMAQKMVKTSLPMAPGVSELTAVGLATEPSLTIAPPRLAEAVAHLECKFVESRRYGGDKGTTVVVGEVVHVHARDDCLDARGSLRPDVGLLGRLGGTSYVVADASSTLDLKRE
jgi:flavin reductase (DIM6/NTAB) family NADH-FMN oxidoreductase RutF